MALGYWGNGFGPRQGWQCPCCKAVFSPDTLSCWNCRPLITTTYTDLGPGVTFTPIQTDTQTEWEWELVSDSTGYVLKKKA